MKNRPAKFIFYGVLLIFLVGILLFWRKAREVNEQSAQPKTLLEKPAANENLAVADAKTDTKKEVAENPKIIAIQAVMAAENAQPQDFYGKVVDQFGEPVVGASVLGTLLWQQGLDVGEKREQHSTQTSQGGEFQFTGFRAWKLAVAVTKDGYQMDRTGAAYKKPNKNNKTSSSERAVFVMWKLRGAMPMVHSKVHAYVVCDGSKTAFNLSNGEKTAAGDLIVTLIRDPIQIQRGKPFTWGATVKFRDAGGFQVINDIYPNEAPEGGYATQIGIDMPKDIKEWSPALQRSYYFKKGNIYGRMTVNIQADYQPPPTSFDIDIYFNPSGSRIIEFDPTKIAKP